MKTIYSSHSSLSKAWVSGTSHTIYSSSRNMLADSERVYSYGHHYTIARKLSSTTVIFNDYKYSPSTSKHRGHVAHALRYNYLIMPDSVVNANDLQAAVEDWCKSFDFERLNADLHGKRKESTFADLKNQRLDKFTESINKLIARGHIDRTTSISKFLNNDLHKRAFGN